VRPHPRRWLIVLALFTVTFGISIPLAAYGVFLPVLEQEFGWSRGAIASALSLNLALSGVAGFAIGALADRHGPRVTLVVTVALAGIAFALVSIVEALWQLYVLVGVLGGVGLSGFYLLAAATVARWFDERRGLALALVLIGFNLGYVCAGPLAAWLIGQVGWRPAYALLGGGCGLVALLAALSVRLPRDAEQHLLRRPTAAMVAHAAAPGTGPDVTLRQALADPRQWWLNGAWLLLGAIQLMLSVHIVPYGRDHGLDLAGASFTLTAYGLGAVVGRLASGAVSDRVGVLATIRASYAIQVLALLTMLLVPAREALLPALVLFGAGFAAADTMVAKVIPEVFGMRALGAIMGILGLGWRLGAALGPAIAGFTYDVTGSYAGTFGAAPVAVLASWAFFALGTARPRR
jgi:MFS family permease